MSDIHPFAGLRARADLAGQVASPPYDVMSTEEAREMARDNPLSFLHVSRAEIDLAPGVDLHSAPVYRKAAENLQGLCKGGVLLREKSPCFYVYRLTMNGRAQHGIVLGASVDEYLSGKIKKHEVTLPTKEDDRTRHIEALQAQAGPVFLTYRERAEISGWVAALCRGRRPEADFVAEDGVGHSLWVCSAKNELAELRRMFASVEALYIADGHHRAAAASRVRESRRARGAAGPSDQFLAVAFPHSEMHILPVYRLVRDLNGQDSASFLSSIRERFTVLETGSADPARADEFGMRLDGQWHRLRALPGTYPADDPVRSLGVAILQDNLLRPILGIDDPRNNPRLDFVGGIRGTTELERRCREDMRVAFSVYPVRVEQLMDIADRGMILPPKSTWFEPKLRSGLVVRELEGRNV